MIIVKFALIINVIYPLFLYLFKFVALIPITLIFILCGELGSVATFSSRRYSW